MSDPTVSAAAATPPGPAPAKVPLSAECTGAKILNFPEAHQRCAGNQDMRLPGSPPGWAPIQIYRCGCTCHRPQVTR